MRLGILLVLVIALGGSCDDIDLDLGCKSAFVEPFPKRPLNLERKWGKELKLIVEDDTLQININHDRKTDLNYLSSTDGNDTFTCFASRFKKHYFLSQPKDSTFNIFMVDFGKERVVGLVPLFHQMLEIDKNVEGGFMEKAVLSKSDDGKRYFLSPEDKELLLKIYSGILAGMEATPRVID